MKKLAILFLVIIVLVQTAVPSTRIFASSADGLVLNLSTNKPVVKSGEEFSYFINYTASSTIPNYVNPSISLQLPAGVTYVSKTDSSITTSTHDGSGLVTFTFRNAVLPAGSAGQLVVKGKFENYTTPDGTTATANATFNAVENGLPVSMDSNSVMVTANASTFWDIQISKSAPTPEPFKGSAVEYEINLKELNSGGNGSLDIKDISVIAKFDADAVFVSADKGGTLGADNTVVWILGDDLRGSKPLKFIVYYPSSIPATEATTIVEMDFIPLGQSMVSVPASVTHGFAVFPDDEGTSFELYAKGREISPGQTVTFNLSDLSNNANIELQNGVLELMTPTQTVSNTPIQFQLQSIKSAIFSGISNYDLYYTLVEDPSAGDWNFWVNLAASVATSSDAVPIGNIKGIQVRFNDTPINWKQLSDFEITYQLDNNISLPAQSSETIKLLAQFQYSFNGSLKTSTGYSQIDIVNDRPLLKLQNTASKSNVVPNETMTYTLAVTNHALLSSNGLDNPVVYNMLPADLEYMPGTWTVVKPAGMLNDSSFTVVPQPSGETKLTWSWDEDYPGVLQIGENIQIKFDAKIKPGTAAKTITNTFGVESPNYLNDVEYSNVKTSGITTYSVEAKSNITVSEIAALRSQMWVKGELDAEWSSAGTTIPGGQALYRLEIQNVGNVAMKDLVIVNPFPRIGDTAVLNGTVPRGSLWGPVLMGGVTAPAYATVYYSTTPGISMNVTTGVDNGVWMTSLPVDPTSVQAIKMVFERDYVIDPLDTTTLEWVMKAPVGAPTSGEVAWNSYAYNVSKVTGQSILSAEPLKVGISIQSSPKASIGDFVWLDSNENGVLDGAETGMNGVIVELYDELGTKLAQTVTSNHFNGSPGSYLFTNLDPGKYRVQFKPDSPYDQFSSDLITIAAGEQYLQLDVGLVTKKGKIGGYVWLDSNENGLQDSGESGMNDVTVELYNGTSILLATTTTATFNGLPGHYEFNNLSPGNYQVRFVLPAGYKFTQQGAGSSVEPSTGRTAVVALAQGEENVVIDAGLIQLALPSVTGRVWLDVNKNGIQDASEEGINGIEVHLYDEHHLKLDQTVTADQSGSKGRYAFVDLPPGKYAVKFFYPDETYLPTLKQAGADITIDSDINGDGSSDLLTLLPGDSAAVDAGLYEKSESKPGIPIITTPTLEPEQKPEQIPNPPKGIFKDIVHRESFLTDMKARIEQANQLKERRELTDYQGHWAEKAIRTFVQLGLVKGYSDGQFKPNREITRAEFVTMLSRMIKINGSSQQTVVLNDIEDNWAKNDLLKLSGAGIVKGYSNGSFMPNQGISREEAVVIISRMINFDALEKDAAKGQFSDLSAASAYARQDVQTAAEVGIVKGKTANIFDPKGKITRAEALTMMMNILYLHPEAKKLLESLELFK